MSAAADQLIAAAPCWRLKRNLDLHNAKPLIWNPSSHGVKLNTLAP
ncbi:MAG: hypothetical protein RLZ09_327 [Pseudomonadota bacterium]